eukprot:2433151-Rhodomonas_salina.2
MCGHTDSKGGVEDHSLLCRSRNVRRGACRSERIWRFLTHVCCSSAAHRRFWEWSGGSDPESDEAPSRRREGASRKRETLAEPEQGGCRAKFSSRAVPSTRAAVRALTWISSCWIFSPKGGRRETLEVGAVGGALLSCPVSATVEGLCSVVLSVQLWGVRGNAEATWQRGSNAAKDVMRMALKSRKADSCRSTAT